MFVALCCDEPLHNHLQPDRLPFHLQTACYYWKPIGWWIRQAGPVTKSEFERRAAEMKARNLSAPRYRNLPPPRSIFAPPRDTASPAKVYVRDFLRDVDINRLSPPLGAIKKLGKLET